MKAMTTRERMQCMLEHREADCVPIFDSPWAHTLERWHREGLPETVSYVDYFGLDRFDGLGLDNSLDMYRELLKPAHKRAVDWAHSKGMKARLH